MEMEMDTETETGAGVGEMEMMGLDDGMGLDFQSVEELQAGGVSATDVKKLVAGGYMTVQSIVMATMKRLCEVRGVSEAKAGKIKDAAEAICAKGNRFMTGTKALEEREAVIRITTGASSLDELLGGGIETMSITEVFGEARMGKTQLCHTLAVGVQLGLDCGGAGGKAIVIDTEGTFRPERIVQIAERYGLNPEEVLENIYVCRAFSHEQQAELLVKAAGIMADDGNIKLLIVDSLTGLFRTDFVGRGQLAERQQTLNLMLSRMSKIASEFNVAVFVTNLVVANPDGMSFAPSMKAVGGHVVAHASTVRLSVRKGRGSARVVKVYQSPCLGEGDAVVEIGEGGVVDCVE